MPDPVFTHVPQAIPGIDSREVVVRDMLSTLMRALAAAEDKVEVICVEISEGVAFHVHCSPADVGKLIGDRGRTARAVRAILKAIASKNGRKYTLIIAQ